MQTHFFVGFAGSPQVDAMSKDIDKLAERFGETPNRQTPVHVTALQPRQIGLMAGFSVADFLAEFAGTLDPVFAFGKPLEVFTDGDDRYLVLPIEGCSFRPCLDALRTRFYSSFRQEPLPLEGVRPHVTLLSTRVVSDRVFDQVHQSARDTQIHTENPVVFTSLNLYERKEGESFYGVSYEARFRQAEAA